MRITLPVTAIAAMLVAACAQDDPSARSARHEPSISISGAAPVAPRPPRVPASYSKVNTSRPVVALTFDDGPHPEYTPKLLDILRHHGVRATFYVIGRWRAANSQDYSGYSV